MGLKIHRDFVATYTYFKSRFCHQYRLPGHTPSEFDITLISKPNIDENPEQYIARIINYVNKSVPVESFVDSNEEDEAAFNDYYAQQNQGEGAAQARERVKNIASFDALRCARKIQNFHIKHTWINGLLQPYADIARAQDKDKTLDQLIDKVQDEGAAKIHRGNYDDHASSMRESIPITQPIRTPGQCCGTSPGGSST